MDCGFVSDYQPNVQTLSYRDPKLPSDRRQETKVGNLGNRQSSVMFRSGDIAYYLILRPTAQVPCIASDAFLSIPRSN
jgi:hypothetical protein